MVDFIIHRRYIYKPMIFQNKNESGFTLIETLLSVSLIAMFMAAMVFCFNPNLNALQIKTDNYITLARYTKAYAQLEGKHTKILINSSNKIQAEIETKINEYKNLDVIQPQIDELNDNTSFELVPNVFAEDEEYTDESKIGISINGIIVMMFSPDGSISETHPITIIPWNQTDQSITNSSTVSISEYFYVSVSYSMNHYNDIDCSNTIITNSEPKTIME
jgi:type II secretory pathway pseudopilin PulG